MKPRLPRSKTMRVATALTGMTACAAGFLPAATAQAAAARGQPGNPVRTRPENVKRVRLEVFPGHGPTAPDTVAPNQPYWLNIWFNVYDVYSYQVCGWHPGNAYRCTQWSVTGNVFGGILSAPHVGHNKYSWDRGQITVKWQGGGPGQWDTCNTNGGYYGSVTAGQSGHESVTLWAPGAKGIGNGVPEC
jgi:hypothetical protein